MKRRRIAQSAFFNIGGSIAVLVCAAGASWVLSATLLAFVRADASSKFSPRTLSFSERVAHQRAIEDVYWHHRIWPKDRPDPKPSLDAVMSHAHLAKKVEDYLRNSQALEDNQHRPITAEQLQAEMDRMTQHTKQPEVLRDIFEALGNDPFVIAECLARPVLAERMTTGLHLTEIKTGPVRPNVVAAATTNYILPKVSDDGNGCTDDMWTPTSINLAPTARQSHTAVWTGSEMIIWGGTDPSSDFNTG